MKKHTHTHTHTHTDLEKKKKNLGTLFLISAHFAGVNDGKGGINKSSVMWIIVGVIVGVVAVTAAA